MEDNNIDKIISMLLDKGYVRCNFDGFEKKHFEYIEQNLNNILLSYKTLFSKGSQSRSEEVELERYRTIVFLGDEDDELMEYDYRRNIYIPKKRKTEEYDLLINLKRRTIPQVLEMYGIK